MKRQKILHDEKGFKTPVPICESVWVSRGMLPGKFLKIRSEIVLSCTYTFYLFLHFQSSMKRGNLPGSLKNGGMCSLCP